MSLHIGKIIKKQLAKTGMSIGVFADKVNISYRNALYLFDRADISVEQLIQISKALDYDFMKDLSISKEEQFHINESGSFYHKVPNDFTTMMFSLTIGGNQKQFEQFPELLKKTRTIAEDLGFKLI